MNKQIATVILICILLTGCQTSPSALDQAATMVAQTVTAAPPTDTPTPTSTPLPTETPTPSPTPTQDPNATATARASAILSELGSSVGDEVKYQDGYLAWQQTDPIIIDMTGPMEKIQGFEKDISAGDFILKSDITWKATGILLCGVIFRSEADLQKGKQYHFLYLRLSGLPAWSIEVHDRGQFKNSPVGINYSDALDLDNGATNQLVLIAQDNQFSLFINDKRQGKFFDNSRQRSDGLIGFLGSQDSGKGSCKFENSWLWVMK